MRYMKIPVRFDERLGDALRGAVAPEAA